MVSDRGGLEPVSFIPLAVDDSASLPRMTSDLEIEVGGVRVRGYVDGILL